jgi:hypothetical protein
MNGLEVRTSISAQPNIACPVQGVAVRTSINLKGKKNLEIERGFPHPPQNPSFLLPSAAAAAAATMDRSMLGDLDGLPEEDKMRVAAMVDQLQIRDRFGPYVRLPDDAAP